MEKIKLTKNELKKQKDALKRFQRYLPTIELKRKQLQSEINRVKHLHEDVSERERQLRDYILSWVDVFGDDINFGDLLSCENIHIETGNIAGAEIPVFSSVRFKTAAYDIFKFPLWVDRAMAEMKKLLTAKIEKEVLGKQIEILKEEMRITTQRVNLFEKIKIPGSKENIRVIQIYMGDEQTASVVRGKIAKNKLVSAEA